MHHLIRVEAVNLGHTILDTDDLSTRRGGSYFLLQAIRDVQSHFAGRLESVSIGASTGLFKVLGVDPQDCAADVSGWLANHVEYGHASFVVGAHSADEFTVANETCIAKGRWRQMQSLSVRCMWDMPRAPRAPAGETSLCCALDGMRPAVETDHGPDGKARRVSASVHVRRSGQVGGRDLRQTFYRRELGNDVPTAGFTAHLGGLSSADWSGDEWPVLPDNLAQKIAVFYADGNGFGAVQSACRSPEDLLEWDTNLRDRRRGLLSSLLTHARSRRPWRTANGLLRLETLMWGGDELTFVVPAWCGLELATLFFDQTADWCHPPQGGRPLHHAAAMVFAHANAPIRRLERLAHELVEQTKQDCDKDRSTLAWVVLESFDHTGSDLADYLSRRYPGTPCPVSWASLRLDADRLRLVRTELPGLRDVLPRSAMVRALRLLITAPPAGTTASHHPLLLRSYESVQRAVVQAGELARWEALWRALAHGQPWAPLTPSGSDIAPWTVLVELWDYALPQTVPMAHAGVAA